MAGEHEQHPVTGQCVACGASGTALMGGCPGSELTKLREENAALRAQLAKLMPTDPESAALARRPDQEPR